MKKEQVHDDPLRMTSLQLVGKTSSAALSWSASKSDPSFVSDMPWDEMESPSLSTVHTSNINDLQNEMTDTISFDNLSGPDESRWRAHGAARRKQLLEEDHAKGGRTFQLKFETSVHRYFSVAHWALEQFHELYQSSKDLEETYVMGHRIVSFLTECLPHHPGLRSAPDIRQRAREELKLLRQCLEDVALQIDEETCNTFVDEFDPIFVVGEDDDDDDSVTNATSKQTLTTVSRSPKKHRMVRFENWEDHPDDEKDWQRKSAESPSMETVETTGTGSLEPADLSYMGKLSLDRNDDGNDSPLRQQSIERHHQLDSGDDMCEIDIGEDEDDTSAAFPSIQNQYSHRHVRLDFLYRIAKEEVPFETDSEAADSWAQTADDAHPLAPSSSGVSPTCDPARIAFRDLLKRLPQQPILHVIKEDQQRRQRKRSSTGLFGKEQHIEEEIRRFLDAEVDCDADGVVELCHQRLKDSSSTMSASSSQGLPLKDVPSSSSSLNSLDSTLEGSAFQPFYQKTETGNKGRGTQSTILDENFLEQDDWISFDSLNVHATNFFESNK